MHWLKRDLWKAGIVVAGVLLLLVLMVWVPIAASAHKGTLGLATPGTVTVQAVPTVDATVTALNKEKLTQDVAQQQHTWGNWLWSNASALVIVLGGLIGLWRWLGDRRSERKKRAEERLNERFEVLSSIVTGLGYEKESARLGAAVLLRIFPSQEGSEQFYTQVFDLAVANLRLPRTSLLSEDSNAPLTPLSQALIVVFKEVFPLAREWMKKRQTLDTSFLQRIKARFKRRAQGEEPFNPQHLDASHIRLDNAFLADADLEGVWMREAFLIEVNLREAKLSKARLSKTNLSKANLRKANLSYARLSKADLSHAHLDDANLHEAYLVGALLIGAHLDDADLSMANLRNASLSGADLSGADFSGANLNGVNLEEVKTLKNTKLKNVKGPTKDELAACKTKGAIIDEEPTTSASQSASAPLPPGPHNDTQTPSIPSAQGNVPSSDTDESSTPSSKPEQ